MTDTVDGKIVVHTSNAAALTTQTIRQIALIVSGATTLLGLLTRQDIAGLIAFAQGDAFVPIIAGVVTLGTMASGWATTAYAKAKLVVVAKKNPADVVVK